MRERSTGSTSIVLERPALLAARSRPDGEPVRQGSGGRDARAKADLAQAREFLQMCYADRTSSAERWCPASRAGRSVRLGPRARAARAERSALAALEARLAVVEAEIERTGTYTHTREELVYGARVAWRAVNGDVGRRYWLGVEVRDLRHVTSAAGVFAELVNHLDRTALPGRYPVRPIISVFAPAAPRQPSIRIWNERLIAYSGYVDPAGAMVGDPETVEFTKTARAYGWSAARTPATVLPLVIDAPREGIQLFDLPDHMTTTRTTTIANLRLTIGGVTYPLAPFNAVGAAASDLEILESSSAAGDGSPRFRRDFEARMLATYGRAPVVPSAIRLPSVPGVPATPAVPRGARRGAPVSATPPPCSSRSRHGRG